MPKNEISFLESVGQGDGEGMTPARFNAELKAFGDVSDVYIAMHSFGGSVADGLAIFEIIKDHEATFTCKIMNAAYSMGSVIPLACDVVEIAENGGMMIHEPWGKPEGTADDLRGQATLLDQSTDKLTAIYVAKTGLPESKIREMMKAETFLTADEAVNLGFVNRISGKAERVLIQAFAPKLVERMPATCLAQLVKQPDAGTTTKEPKMTTKQVATSKDIRAACKNASAEFILAQVEAEASIEEATAEWASELAKENAELKAKMKAMEEEEEEAKAKAAKAMEEEEEEIAKAAAEAEVKAKLKTGSAAVGNPGSPQTGESATAIWNTKLEEKAQQLNGNRQRASSIVNRQNPGLRAKMLAESNQNG